METLTWNKYVPQDISIKRYYTEFIKYIVDQFNGVRFSKKLGYLAISIDLIPVLSVCDDYQESKILYNHGELFQTGTLLNYPVVASAYLKDEFRICVGDISVLRNLSEALNVRSIAMRALREVVDVTDLDTWCDKVGAVSNTISDFEDALGACIKTIIDGDTVKLGIIKYENVVQEEAE